MRRRAMILSAFLSVATTTVALAQGSQAVIGSPTAGKTTTDGERAPEQSLTVRPSLQLVELVGGAAEVARLGGLRRHTVGPFDQARFGFSFVDVYFDRALLPEEHRETFSANSTLRLTVGTRQAGGIARFWLLSALAGTPVDLLSINDEPNEQELARLATDDPSLPILDVQYGSHTFGANSGAEWQRHLLIDFRARTPTVIALLEDVDHSGGGACTAYDGLYGTAREIGCQWERTQGDFRCAETLHRYDTDWGERRGSRFLFLGSGKALPNPPMPDEPSLIALAERTRASPKPIRTANVAGLGQSAIIDTLRFDPSTVILLGSPILTESHRERFGTRLHVVVLHDGQEAIVREIAPRTQLEQGLPENPAIAQWLDANEPGQPSEQFVPDGLVPAFKSRLLVDRARFKVLQLTVSEGSARAVYLVGLDFSGAELVAEALLIASDAPRYNACNSWLLPATAVGIKVGTQPFRAVLDIEPANLERRHERTDGWELQPRSEKPLCRATAEVTWQANVGFAITWSSSSSCVASEPPRRVAIDDDGRLTSSNTWTMDRPRR